MLVAPHNSNSPLCTTVSVHAALGIPNLKILETFDGLLEPFVFAEHPPTHRFWNMFEDGWEKRRRT